MLFASLFTNEGKIDFKSPPLTVNVTNVLSDRNNQLTVHCKSGDDDLGVHILPHLISYAFTFRPNSGVRPCFIANFNGLVRYITSISIRIQEIIDVVMKLCVCRLSVKEVFVCSTIAPKSTIIVMGGRRLNEYQN